MQIRIAHLLSSGSRLGAGVTNSVRGLSSALSSGPKLEQKVFFFEDEFTDADKHLWRSIATNGSQRDSWLPFFASNEMWTQVKNFSPDLVHVHGIWTSISSVGERTRLELGKPTIISPHGMLNEWALKHKRMKKTVASVLYQKRQIRNASAIHALSPAELEFVRKYTDHPNTFVVANGISHEADEEEINLTRERTVLFVGRLHKVKGLEHLIDAWSILLSRDASRFRNWKLKIVGAGDSEYKTSLEQRIQRLRLTDYVHFLGPLYGEDLNQQYRLASLLVQPSLSEAFPLTVLEALSNGLPTIVSRNCNLGIESKSITVSDLDGKSLSDSIASYVELDRTVQARRSIEAYNLSKANFSWDAIATKMAEKYIEVMETKSRKPT